MPTPTVPADPNDAKASAAVRAPGAGYEVPDPDRPATAAPTEGELVSEGLAARGRRDPYAAWRSQGYRRFSGGTLLYSLGHQVQSAAISWEVYHRTGSPLALGWVAGVQAVAAVALALPGGLLADRFSRRHILATTAVLSAACSVAMAGLSRYAGPVAAVYASLLAYAAFRTLGGPSRSAVLPSLVPAAAFPNAITWSASLFQVSGMVGPAVGGAIVWWADRRAPLLPPGARPSYAVAYLVNAACAASFAACVLVTRPHPGAGTPAGPARAGRPWRPGDAWADVAEGVRFIRRAGVLLPTMLLDLFAVLLGGAAYLLPVFAADVLHVAGAGYGALRAAEATGAFATALLLSHLPPMRHAGRTMLLAVAGFGAVTIVFGLSRSFPLSFAMLVLLGACDNVSVVVRHTLIQTMTPDAMRGRVSAVNSIFISSSNEIGGVESGLTAAWLGPVPAVVLGGLGTLAVVATVAKLSPDLVRHGPLAREDAATT